MNSMKRQRDMTLNDELLTMVGSQYATGEEWRNNARKNEEMEPEHKQRPVVDVTGDESKLQCCKEYNQSDFSIDHLVMSMCRVFSCIV